ncbi:TraB/GumN family protein [Parapedobacter sp. 2B3]|uniref:TraB/GumN family protein n=1 Tax=Parapedobacter sp. 2B3 TaxID=3342381 RepID=UPI0035B5FD60
MILASSFLTTKNRNHHLKTMLVTLFATSLTLFARSGLAQVPQEKALLWEVAGPGLDQPSYLFGTFHLLCASDIEPSETLRAKLAATQALCLELDFSDPALVGQMMQQAPMRGDTSLAHFFSEATYEQLSSDFERFTGAPLQFMARMKPYLLMPMLMMPLLQCEVKGWEQTLVDHAAEQGIGVKALETVADQMAIFDAIPYRLQAEQLQKSLESTDSLASAMKEMIALYKQEDIVKLYQLVTEEPTLRSYSGLLLDERNERWIPMIGEQARLAPTFFAVGAGHLGGEKGVINLLRQAGYTVSPVAQ